MQEAQGEHWGLNRSVPEMGFGGRFRMETQETSYRDSPYRDIMPILYLFSGPGWLLQRTLEAVGGAAFLSPQNCSCGSACSWKGEEKTPQNGSVCQWGGQQ